MNQGRLTDIEIMAIKQLYKVGATIPMIAEYMNLSLETVQSVFDDDLKREN